MSVVSEWVIAVFRCKPQQIKSGLIEFYGFVDDLKGVRSLHFLIRDRVDDELVLSFRIMTEPKRKEIIRRKIVQKLSALFSDEKFAVNPSSVNPLYQYVAWNPSKRIAEYGIDKFEEFIDILCNMSQLVVKLLKNDYFASYERVELAHVMSWMVGCTEYGLLSTTGIEVGYYDRVEDKYVSYLRENFPR